MQRDISTRGDIELVVKKFYTKLLVDKEIGHFFNEVVVLDLDHHLPVIIDFWEGILLDNPVYQGNPMIKHIELNQKSNIEPNHFLKWLNLWEETIQEDFVGAISEKAVERAKSIAALMEYKLNEII